MIERARHLGGVLEISSEIGNGTSAHLILPHIITRSKKKIRVMLVDDHAIVRNAIRQLLEDATDDFSVEGEASDGEAAIEMAIDGDWDIVLLDINLPKVHGFQVLEKIKSVKPNLPIIVLSSYAKVEYEELAITKGAACYIEKTKTDKLVEAILQLTTKSRI